MQKFWPWVQLQGILGLHVECWRCSCSTQLSQNMDDHRVECLDLTVERKQSIAHGLTEEHKSIISSCGLNAPNAIIKFSRITILSVLCHRRVRYRIIKLIYTLSQKCGGRNQLTIKDAVDFCGENSKEVMSDKDGHLQSRYFYHLELWRQESVVNQMSG